MSLQAIREKISAAYRMDEDTAVKQVFSAAMLSATQIQAIKTLAEDLVTDLRTNRADNPFRTFMAEYDLSSAEGVTLMCLAEAILRIPDKATIEKLISDKISHADWAHHLGKSKSTYVNSATWSLLLTGKIMNLSGVLTGLLRRCGEPIVRQAVTYAVKLLCKQFVIGQTIEEGLITAQQYKESGFTFSYDMLGEEARTAADANIYFDRYMFAIKVVAAAANNPELNKRDGISVKLSALHPRFEWRQRTRVLDELLPKLKELCMAAMQANIGLTIDAEEAERLDLSLDLFTELCRDPRFAMWPGLGFAVQAYQKRAPYVIEYLIQLAKDTQRRIPIRLVKGAYWDTEIKLAQEKGLSGYPVYTRKAATDLSYIACVKQILAATDWIYPQFATHNAFTIGTILQLAGDYTDFEFQALFGMGEDLYSDVAKRYGRSCRLYAPVGSYNYLFGYLVRRMLENGANTSFLNQLNDESIAVDELLTDPFSILHDVKSIPHSKIPLPVNLYPDRPNSVGVDFTNPSEYAPILATIESASRKYPSTAPQVTTPEELEKILRLTTRAADFWAQTDLDVRIGYIQRMAELLQANKAELIALLVLEGRKTILDAQSEVREAIDYCWYYAACARKDYTVQTFAGPTGELNQLQLHPRGIIVCISPWNFPLAIFLGQVLAALVAGNVVLAKPAGQTTRIATKAIALLHSAGIPKEVLHLIIGSGAQIGDRLVQDLRIDGVMFTGSTETAWHINRTLAARQGAITPLIAETGGQNVMIVDSSALAEQVVQDVVISAFGSAGQRCSCLRVLYVQEDVADSIITMLCGAMAELTLGDPGLLDTDIGPVIDQTAYAKLQQHRIRLQETAQLLYAVPVPIDLQQRDFFAPCAFEINSIAEIPEEIFGPILHVIRYQGSKLADVVNEINNVGYGLTMGIHSRIDDTVEFITQRAKIGNIYVNRNMIGAVVGVQPFGGEGLSGTGPKAGGPYYVQRLGVERTISTNTAAVGGNASLLNLRED